MAISNGDNVAAEGDIAGEGVAEAAGEDVIAIEGDGARACDDACPCCDAKFNVRYFDLLKSPHAVSTCLHKNLAALAPGILNSVSTSGLFKTKNIES